MAKSLLQSQLEHVLLIIGETRSCHHPRRTSQKEDEACVSLGVLTKVLGLPVVLLEETRVIPPE